MSFENMATETTPETPVVETATIETTPPQVSEVPVEPEFTPNYKYKAYGKEYEVDEWARPLINKDNQEHLIKLYEKSGGFDHLKNNFKELEQKHMTIEGHFNQLNNVRQNILSSIDKGELGKAFNVIGLTDEQIFNYVKQKLEYQQLPADQRQVVDHYRSQVESRQQTEQLLEQQRSLSEQIMMQKHELELEKTFNNPKYASIIADYNTRVGDEQAFKSVIRQVGATEYYATGKNLPVEEATERAIKMLALNPAKAVEISTQAINAQQPVVPAQNTPAPKPIMRVGKGGGQAPISQQPRSIADINKIYQQEYGA